MAETTTESIFNSVRDKVYLPMLREILQEQLQLVARLEISLQAIDAHTANARDALKLMKSQLGHIVEQVNNQAKGRSNDTLAS